MSARGPLPLRGSDAEVWSDGDAGSRPWDERFDVVVVGFGGAGASAAIEAARAGAEVLVVDRFDGGGATAMSGGVIYAGGGTELQTAAGYDDSPEEMRRYLELESGDAVGPETIRAFCERSRGNVEWLRALGVPMPPSGKALKTSYPPDDCTLYFSGNEAAAPYRAASRPAPRGHRVLGEGRTGNVLFERLRTAAEAVAVVRRRCLAERLVVDDRGAVLGLELSELPSRRVIRALHTALCRLGTYCGVMHRGSTILFQRLLVAIERRFGQRRLVRARGGVVLATGGFVYNPEMLAAHAAPYASATMRLGTIADRGDGVALGQSVGGVTGEMGSCCAIRFIDPPSALVGGLFLDRRGERVCNEELYGSSLGNALARPEHDGRGWLVFDADVAAEARRQLFGGGLTLFQLAFGAANLFLNRRRAGSIAALEARCEMPKGALARAVELANEDVARQSDRAGKSAARLAVIRRAPFYAVNMDLANVLFPTPTLTLGGLRTDGVAARVVDAQGKPITGLYAAGRTAVGISSRSYVSGLSLADCIFSGRNAGAAAAVRTRSLARVTASAISLATKLERGLRVDSTELAESA